MRRSNPRLAAAVGIDFVAAVAAIAVIERWKHLNTPGEIAVHASNNVFATVTLLHGVAAVFLFWFVSTLAARMRQLEGGSGRLASAVNGSGVAIAAILAVGVGAMWAAHQLQSPESAAMATSFIDGPTLFFPAAVLVGAAGVIGFRTPRLPGLSRIVSTLSIPLAVAFVGGAALMLFNNYAWINDTGYIVFGVWVLILSLIGTGRWGDLDGEVVEIAVVDETPAPVSRRPSRRAAVVEAEPEPDRRIDLEPETTPERAPRRRREPRKFAPRHTDLARDYQRRLHEQEDEEGEEFGYGGPPRMTEPVDVTPARRPARKKPAQRRKPRPRPQKDEATSADEAETETPAHKPKPAPRKPRPPRKFAPRAPRVPAPEPEPTEDLGPADLNEDDEAE